MNTEPRQRHPLVSWAWSLLRLKFVGIAFGALVAADRPLPLALVIGCAVALFAWLVWHVALDVQLAALVPKAVKP